MPLSQTRDATPDDIPAIARIYGREVETGIASFEEVAPSEAEMAARLAKIQGLGLPYLVAANDDELLGFSYAGPFHNRSAYRFTLEDTVYVAPSAQRRGVGRALLTRLIERCEVIGCRQLMALIVGTEGNPSIALHEVLGFRMTGTMRAVGYKFGRWADVVTMQRAIGPGDTTLPDRSAPGQHFTA